MLIKVVIIGPESTGKSDLCTKLAEHFNSLSCPEYAREYLSKHGNNYTYDDLLKIAKGQIALEDEAIQKAEKSGSRYLFIDTDMYVMKVWCEFVFQKCHPYILDQIVKRKYEMYLLCNIDLMWTPDSLREYPDLERREQLFKMYKDLLVNQSTQWDIVRGEGKERIDNAIAAVTAFKK